MLKVDGHVCPPRVTRVDLLLHTLVRHLLRSSPTDTTEGTRAFTASRSVVSKAERERDITVLIGAFSYRMNEHITPVNDV